MTLRNRILQSILVGILGSVLLAAVVSYVRVNQNFENYLIVDRQLRVSQILSDIEDLYRDSQHLSVLDLQRLAGKEELYLEIFDSDGNSIEHFDGIHPTKTMQGEYVQKDIPIFGSLQNRIGTIRLGYWDNSILSQSAQSFRSSLTISFIFALLIGFAFASIASFWISRRITMRVEEIIHQTQRIQSGDFSLKPTPEGYAKEFDQLTENINQLSETLEKQESSRKKYAQDIAHELRTPVTSIKLQLSAIRDGILEPSEDNLKLLLEEANRLNRLIEMLKNSFQDGEEWTELHIQTIDCKSFLLELTDSIRPLFEADQCKLFVEAPESCVLDTDPAKLRQVLYNLLSNAKKALCTGGTARMRVSTHKGSTVFVIEDDGIGIRKEDLPHIFDRFYRADTARNTKLGGTGLGLAIVKSTVISLKGSIYAESDGKNGSRFTVTLPTVWKQAPEAIKEHGDLR